LSVPGEILCPPPRDGWAALNIVRARAEAAPAVRVRVASERRDRNGTSILQKAAVYRLVVGRSQPDLKSAREKYGTWSI
jgi:hypothetical protein